MKNLFMTALLGLMCLITNAAQAEQVTVAELPLNYGYLGDVISMKLSMPISIDTIKPKYSKMHVNMGAKVVYALAGAGMKVYSADLKHDNGQVSKCDMSIQEGKSGVEEGSNLITINISNCDGFLMTETMDGRLTIQEYIKR